jgi:hypothetical protein
LGEISADGGGSLFRSAPPPPVTAKVIARIERGEIKKIPLTYAHHYRQADGRFSGRRYIYNYINILDKKFNVAPMIAWIDASTLRRAPPV